MAKKGARKVTIEEWVSAQCYGREDTSSNVREVRLVHVANGGESTDQVDVFQVPEKPGDTVLASLADSIRNAAEVDATAIGKVQKYALHAMFDSGDGDLVVKARFLFMQRPDDEVEEDGIRDSEPPTPIGLVAQTQRHLEGTMRLALLASSQSMERQGQMIEKLGDTVNTLLDERFKNMELMAKLLDHHEDRAAARQEREVSADFRRKAGDEFMPMAKMVLIKLLGGKTTGAAPQFDAIKQLVGTLEDGQLSRIAEALSPSQQVMLFEVIQTINSQSEEKPALPAGDAKAETPAGAEANGNGKH